jgi:hypothetical protein
MCILLLILIVFSGGRHCGIAYNDGTAVLLVGLKTLADL